MLHGNVLQCVSQTLFGIFISQRITPLSVRGLWTQFVMIRWQNTMSCTEIAPCGLWEHLCGDCWCSQPFLWLDGPLQCPLIQAGQLSVVCLVRLAGLSRQWRLPRRTAVPFLSAWEWSLSGSCVFSVSAVLPLEYNFYAFCTVGSLWVWNIKGKFPLVPSCFRWWRGAG